MSKRVLIVEKSLAVRGIAESLLRQNRFEVLTADSAETAQEILSGSKIELFLVSSDIKVESGSCFYEWLGSDKKTAAVPLLILHDPAGGDLPFPPEAIINKPFTPRDFLATVSVFCGELDMAPAEGQPFQGSDLEDDIIDAALGLDKIEVDGSAVMVDDTTTSQRKNHKNIPESMIGFESKNGKDKTSTSPGQIDQVKVKASQDSQEVETPVVEPEQTPVSNKDHTFLGVDSDKMPASKPEMSESSKIEIVTDQYGLVQTPDLLRPEKKEAGGHDYDWFINEMQDMAKGVKPTAGDSGTIQISPNSDGLAPVAPPPTTSTAPTKISTQSVQAVPSVNDKNGSQPVDLKAVPESKTEHGEAVDKFISEFKKEMEKISDDSTGGVPTANIPAPSDSDSASLKWQESTGGGTARIGAALSEEKIDDITQRIIDKIFVQISRETLYRIIREAISESISKG